MNYWKSKKRENQTDSLLMYIISNFKNKHSRISVMNREDRIRTCDTLVPNQVLYQAELLPELNRKMHPRGVEPLTAWFVVRYSIQLS